MTATAGLTTGSDSRARGDRRALTVLRYLLAAQFAVGGALKLGGAEVMVTMFNDIGLGDGLRYTVGVVEIAGAIGLLVPGLVGAAAAGLAALMFGAAVTRAIALGGPPVLELALLLVLGLLARSRLRSRPADTS